MCFGEPDIWQTSKGEVMKRIGSICLLGIGSGLAISIGGTVYLSVENPVVGSVLFAVGLYAVVLNGLYLYTGKIGYLVEQKEKKPYLILLLTTWIGNLVGTALGAGLLSQTRIGGNIRERAAGLCQTKLSDSLASILILAFFCGILMYVAVEGFRSGGNPLIVIFSVSVFILCGFEHCIANMFYFSLAGVWSLQTVGYLLVMTLGNSLGGMLLPAFKRARP